MSDDDRPDSIPASLLDLAARYGVVPDFWGYDGTHKWVSPQTLSAVLGALGVDASSPERVDVSLQNAEDDPWRRMLPPVVVVREGAGAQVAAHVTDGAAIEPWIELDDEVGGGVRTVVLADVYVPPRTVDGRTVGRATIDVPADLPLGWHTLAATSEDQTARCTLVVVPARLSLQADLDKRRAWGFMAQLYSVRSTRSWGLGDLADLREIAWMSAQRCGADFLLINPLHAAEPVLPLTPSPYLPSTRRFVSPLYLRPEEILETAYLPVAERSLVEWQAEVARPLSTETGPIDRDAVWAAKRVALEVIYTAPRSATRQAQFAAFREGEGAGLEDFALWCALAEHFEGAPWPAEADDRGSDLVRTLRVTLADRVTFHCWLQWVLDDQLAAAQRAAVDGGMRMGIMHDLAVGVHPEGADAWAMRD
ncbi:MAG: 4-alpha-glucanotransferase, partial [Cellulomonadaceae bacterium]|nr:4-alpha-glucanotransferase [Cellulomonadaceae bacterium]